MDDDLARAGRRDATVRTMGELERVRNLDALARLFGPQAGETFPFGDGSNDVIELAAGQTLELLAP